MKKIQLLFASIFLIAFTSCTNDTENEQSVTTATNNSKLTAKSALVNPTVYAAGYGQSSWTTQTASTIWTDGVEYNLTDGVYTGTAWSVYKEGTDVYVLTKEYNQLVSGSNNICKVWKNNVLQYTLPSTPNTHPNSLFVSGGTVYVVGRDYVSSKFVAKLWVNGVVTTLSTGTTNAEAASVYVSSGTVYIAGYEQASNGNYVAKLWKKVGQAAITSTDISANTSNSYATSVFVVGTDVYVGGKAASTINNFGFRATVWKNSVPTYLTDGAYDASVNSVFVLGTNVHSAGYKYNGTNSLALVWKNSVVTQLSVGTNAAFAYSVFAYGNDVYVGGIEQNPSFSNVANVGKIWKNGAVYFQTSQGYYHNITSIFVQ
ncbi:hypothetical protein AR687_06630 [Flavobacteriaceae bacterium CRH]|nr:hypothetical protein AR687_06630 [Flavobacteriaceae bacterium CRH]